MGGGGSPNSDNDGQGGRRGKKSNILPDVLCEWPLIQHCSMGVFDLCPDTCDQGHIYSEHLLVHLNNIMFL